WMVARASYTFGPHGNVINGQQYTINADANVFNGPETDNLGSSYRSDNIHLDTGQGIAGHANLWYNYITNGFLSSSQPVMAQDLIELDFACNGDNTLNISTPSSYAEYD